MSWTIRVEVAVVGGPVPHRLALEVDPRRLQVSLVSRVEGTGGLEIQSGAIARSFFELETGNLEAAARWLEGEEAQQLLETIQAGYHCELLWSGDPVVSWNEAAWEAGHRLYLQVGEHLVR